jgi:DNA-binding phage protein
MKTSYADFDPADYLDNDDVIAEYLSAARANPNPDVLLAALADVAKALKSSKPAKSASGSRSQ